MINPLEIVCEDISTNLAAMHGLESGVQEQTATALELIQEVVGNEPNTDAIAVVPVGSRFKGYATEESDLDVVMLAFEEGGIEKCNQLRGRIHRVVRDKVGVSVWHDIGGALDRIFTMDMSQSIRKRMRVGSQCAYLFAPVAFFGPVAEERRQMLVGDNFDNDKLLLERTKNDFSRYFLSPSPGNDIGLRYLHLAPDVLQFDVDEVLAKIDNAYQERHQKFGSAFMALSAAS